MKTEKLQDEIFDCLNELQEKLKALDDAIWKLRHKFIDLYYGK